MQATPNMTCLVVNHENTTWNYYRGRDRAFLLPIAIFRPGGAAVLLSNRFDTPRQLPSSDTHVCTLHVVAPTASPPCSETGWISLGSPAVLMYLALEYAPHRHLPPQRRGRPAQQQIQRPQVTIPL